MIMDSFTIPPSQFWEFEHQKASWLLYEVTSVCDLQNENQSSVKQCKIITKNPNHHKLTKETPNYQIAPI